MKILLDTHALLEHIELETSGKAPALINSKGDCGVLEEVKS